MMKWLGIILFLTVWIQEGSAQSDAGIRFFQGTWQEALEEAKHQNKWLFVDIWASWCGPCKRMAAEILVQKEVGDYFNERFVCYKLMTDPSDKEEKKVAEEVSKRYHVNFLPTLLWVDAEGTLLHYTTGFQSKEALIQQAKIAQDPERRLGTLLQRWKNGERSLEAGMAYFSAFPQDSKSFDEFYLHLSPQEQCDTNLQTMMLFSLTLATDSRVPHYIASHWKEQFAVADRPDYWISFLSGALERELEICWTNQQAFKQVGDRWKTYGFPFTECAIDKSICLQKLVNKEYDDAYRQLETMMGKYRDDQLFFIVAVLYELFNQLCEGELTDSQKRPVLMEYAERFLATQPEDCDPVYQAQIRLLSYVVCGEKEKAEKCMDEILPRVSDEDERAYLDFLFSPLKQMDK